MTDQDTQEPTRDRMATEVAEAEFARFVELMALDLDPAVMDDEDKAALKLNKDRMIKAIVKGSLVINDDGEPIYTPQRGDDPESNVSITFREPTGASLISMDRKKQNKDVSKMFALMADITKETSVTFSKMKMSDLNVCMAITTLFLG